MAEDDDLVIAAITVAELRTGIELATERHRAARAEFFVKVLETLPVEPYDLATADIHGRLLAHVHRSTYYFRDETGFGPTTSPGGIYPNGDITHVYPKRGVYDTHIEVDYGGEYSVDGGAWRPIPGTVHISGPVQLLTVKASYARLVK